MSKKDLINEELKDNIIVGIYILHEEPKDEEDNLYWGIRYIK